jgi:MFS family permease
VSFIPASAFLAETFWKQLSGSHQHRYVSVGRKKQYMETTPGNARVAGLARDLRLDDSKYSAALLVFFVTYLIFEPPSNMLLGRLRPSVYLPGITLGWGVIAGLVATVQNFAGLVVIRLVLGAVEAGFVSSPCNTASIYGAYIWPSTSGPQYRPGNAATAAFTGSCAALALLGLWLHKRYPYEFGHDESAKVSPEEVREGSMKKN